MDYRITLWIDGKPIEQHSLAISVRDKDFYRAGISLDAFSTRESRRLYWANTNDRKHAVEGKRCHVQNIDGMHHTHLLLPAYHHASVWDFYKAVGYDYKKKKYIT